MKTINRKTYQNLLLTAKSNAHAVMLSGMQGSGKGYTAKSLCILKLGLTDHSQLEAYPYFKHIMPKDQKITIDKIREINSFFKLKAPGKNLVRRAVVIEDAHLMNIESQNALLKSLEEPPDDTFIVLTSTPTESLKDTIRSRVQTINVLPLTLDEANELMPTDTVDSEKKKLFMMSGGLAGLLYNLINNNEHILIEQIDIAKKLITSSKYNRLRQIEEISKDKAKIPLLLQSLKIISTSAANQNASKDNPAGVQKWHNISTAVYQSEKMLPRNPNPKLLLTSLMLKM